MKKCPKCCRKFLNLKEGSHICWPESHWMKTPTVMPIEIQKKGDDNEK